MSNKLPVSIEASSSVLGICLMNADLIDIAIESLPDETFFHLLKERTVYKHILKIHRAGEPVDLITVAESIRTDNNNTDELLDYLTELIEWSYNRSGLANHCSIVKDKALKRKLLNTITIATAEIYEDTNNFDEIYTDLNASLKEGVGSQIEVVDYAPHFIETYERMFSKRSADGVIGIKLGNTEFDRFTMGFQPGKLYMFGGHSGHGKSAIMCDMLRYNIKKGKRGCIFSLEMEKDALIQRLIFQESRVKSYRFFRDNSNSNAATQEELNRVAKAASFFAENESLIRISDERILTPDEMDIGVKKIERDLGSLDYIWIDSSAFVSIPKRYFSAREEIAIKQRILSFRNMAKEMKCPVLCVSPLNSKLTERPKANDLYGAKQQEYITDTAFMIDREEKRLRKLGKDVPDNLINMAMLIIDKNRDGAETEIPVQFHAEYATYEGPPVADGELPL